MKPQYMPIEDRAVTQALRRFATAIDQLGVSEPIIQEHGLGHIRFGATAWSG